MKACRLTRQRILRDVDADLPLAELLGMDAHLQSCASCRDYRAQLMGLDELVGLLPEPALERLDLGAASEAIQARIAGQRAQPGVAQQENSSWRRPLVAPSPARRALQVLLVAAALIACLGLWKRVASESKIENAPRAASDAQASHVAPTESASVATDSAVSEPLTRERVEANLRGALAESFAAPGATLLRRSALQSFDQRMDTSHARWPLASMAERLLEEEDLALARAAARYLGLRGGRLSVVSLRAGLGRPELAEECVLALGDLGELGLEALGAALQDQELCALALDQLARSRNRAAAEVVEQSLLRHGHASSSNALHLNALGLIGQPAIPALMRLLEHPRLERRDVIAAIDLVHGAGAELARLLRQRHELGNTDLIFEVLDQLQAIEMLPWLEAQVADFEHRQRALASLVRLPGTQPVAVLMGFDQRGRLGQEELSKALGALAAAGPARMRLYAEELVAKDDALAATHLLSLLIASAEPGGAAALAVLVVSELLTVDQRQWAALALCELGGREEARLLRDALSAGELSERRLMAACLITVFHALGEEGVYEALDSYPQGALNDVFKILGDVSSDPKKPQATVQLFRLARALNMAHLSRNPRIGQSSL